MKKLICYVISCFLLVSSFLVSIHADDIYVDGGNSFPMTRTDYVIWHVGAFVTDLGEVQDTVTTGNNSNVGTIGTSTVKHEYKITYEISFNCNGPCTLGGNPEEGYNLTESSGVIYYNQRFQKLPSDMQAFLDVTNYGTKSESYTYTTPSQIHRMTVQIQLLDATLTRTFVFAGLTEGVVLSSINTQLGALALSFNGWKDLDEQQKVREIEQWIWQLNTFRNMPTNTVQSIKNYLNNNDTDSAYQVLYDYMDNIISGESDSINNAQGNNTSARNNFNSQASQEMSIASNQESEFSNAIGQIDSSNPFLNLTDFSNSAQWVRDRFNEITHNNAFGSLLQFSLILGLALAIIGRIL